MNNVTIIVGENGAYNGERKDFKLFVTHNYDKVLNAADMLLNNDKHIVLNIDNNTYEIKEALLKSNTELVFKEAKVLIENNLTKINFTDNKTHKVSLDHYDDIVDLSNVTLASANDMLVLYFDGAHYGLDIGGGGK